MSARGFAKIKIRHLIARVANVLGELPDEVVEALVDAYLQGYQEGWHAHEAYVKEVGAREKRV